LGLRNVPQLDMTAVPSTCCQRPSIGTETEQLGLISPPLNVLSSLPVVASHNSGVARNFVPAKSVPSGENVRTEEMDAE
jgi:hypothetical protein